VANLCVKTRVGQLYTTPWKSVLIKDISQAGRIDWGNILNKYRVNVRHAANELNWQIEDLCTEGLKIKQELVRAFEEADLRTYRLSFAIKTQPKTGLLGSIIIRKQSPGVFGILHSRDFNPNNKDYVAYNDSLSEADLASELMQLCEYYYSQTTNDTTSITPSGKNEVSPTTVRHMAYQCRNCLSIYDQRYGDEVNSIAPGKRFENIESYTCPVCESPKGDFVAVSLAG
jgi:rubredoxin